MKNCTTPRTPSTVTIPPHVVALAVFAADHDGSLPADFVAAWGHMPALVEQLGEGRGSDNTGTTIYDIAQARIDRRIHKSRTSEYRTGRELAQIADWIHEAMGDRALRTLEGEFGLPWFYTGLALGLYLLSHPAPMTFTTEHAE